MRWLVPFTLMIGAGDAGIIIATRTLPANTVVAAADLDVQEGGDGLRDPLVGMEVVTTILAGQQVRIEQLRPATVIQRNQRVTLRYHADGLEIVTEGRAMDRAAPGTVIGVMNLASRLIVQGVVDRNGTINVTLAE